MTASDVLSDVVDRFWYEKGHPPAAIHTSGMMVLQLWHENYYGNDRPTAFMGIPLVEDMEYSAKAAYCTESDDSRV